MGWAGRPKAPSNSPVGLGNQSPWSGEPWANHGEPDHGKSGKCPELRDGREVSAGVRVDLETPRVNGLSTRRVRREWDQGERGKGRPLASSRGWTTPKCIREPSGYSNQ